ncbi:hypothetical protein Z951_21460 [Streptomyces sp. PRh5]|uniref:DUF4097 family beta strand repeat-containing protein n=1 Tax=Streptomyces sp. PRh5 TaxID=1158056 RepID=UPI00045197DB|nr:DUF4097 family beta strand repeat-containing protein [Streptomyces sp. PRh5]EXU66166.1 hypothetical protein Z951_21460 [Streptomyces sp. PRh5]
MTIRLRSFSAVLAGGLAVVGLSACGPGETFEDDASLNERVTSVRLDTGTGSVTLRGQKGLGKVSVHRKVTYHGDKPDGATHRFDDGRLVLDGCGDDCKVDYTVEVPAGVPVEGETSRGDASLSNVGAVELKTSSGNVTLEGVTGRVKARTSNGDISGSELLGSRIEAETSNGEIDLTPRKAQDIRARTSNGELTVNVPDSSYRISVKTGNGDKHLGIHNDPAGQHRLDLTSGNGDITVKPA